MKNLISELICTRISHDIIGNIGAVANASELLEEGDIDFLDDIKDILKTSSFNLSSRMKFFRMAFGIDNSNIENFELVKKTTEDYLLSLGNPDYPIKPQFNINNAALYKNAMVMIMIMADLLIRGGVIIINSDDNKIMVEISHSCKISNEKLSKVQGLLEGKAEYLDANTAPLALLIEKCGIDNINLTDNGQGFCLSLTRD